MANRATNDQWRSGIINQYTVHFIHHGKMMFALYHFIRAVHHIIPQVIKAKFVVGAVGNIGVIGRPAGISVGFVLINTVNG